jgi:signal transduction histidine kinase
MDLEVVLSAVTDKELVLNGSTDRERRRRLVSGHDLALEAVQRSEDRHNGVEPKIFWDAGEAMVLADPGSIRRALDSLIEYALEQAGSPIWLTGSIVADRLRVTISGGGADDGYVSHSAASSNGASNSHHPQRGESLALVSQIAAAHGGRFALTNSCPGLVEMLELPLAISEAAA